MRNSHTDSLLFIVVVVVVILLSFYYRLSVDIPFGVNLKIEKKQLKMPNIF